MESLHTYHRNLLKPVSLDFRRFIYEEINWDQRMLAIKGPRGSGKTTLMLQRIKYGLKLPSEESLYLTADHHWFYTNTLFETAEQFYLNGGRYLFIDEVHKYPRWSRELKNLYDGFPDLRIVFSASSALDIYRGEADLSRRVITYNLPGMSFREYLKLTGKAEFDSFTLQEIKSNHQAIAGRITDQIQPLPLFKNYLKFGYLPIINESAEEEIGLRLNQIITAVVESDLSSIEGFDSGTATKIKKLLGVVAESAPFKPNISSLARKLDSSRDSVYAWLRILEHARLLNSLQRAGKGVSVLQKPDKIYLGNTNLAYTMKENPDIGSLRKSFMLSQLRNAGHEVTMPETGDFLVNGITIEVGGRNKSAGQIKDADQPIVAADGIESGFKNKIPLWLFGFLY